MWTIRTDEIRALQGKGGEPFTAFVDDLIHAAAWIGGLPFASTTTNLRTTIKDGGVDTTVAHAVPGDSSGWLGGPTAWQYKAKPWGNVEGAAALLDAWRIRELVDQGYAYRLAVADSLAEPVKSDEVEKLTDEVRKINSAARPPLILTADDLATWASRFPGMTSSLRATIETMVRSLPAWGGSITDLTHQFVPVVAWEGVRGEVLKHIALSQDVPDVLLPITGQSGVGKTRSTFEALASVPGMAALVVYTEDEDIGHRIANALANDERLQAVLVVDECSPDARVQLTKTLRGRTKSVRVIAIDASGTVAGIRPEMEIPKMSREVLESILEKNYPGVPVDARRAYAAMSIGFPLVAADLCRHHGLAAGGLGGAPLLNLWDYLQQRVKPPENLKTLLALSLVTSVGYKGPVRSEIEQLCKYLRLDAGEVTTQALKVREQTGFIGRGGKVFYVTPPVVAHVLFGEAWKLWAADEPETFLAGFPPDLLDRFLKRVSDFGKPEVSRACGDYFRDWTTGMTLSSLTDSDAVDRLVVLTDADPERYLPVVRRLLESATRDQLLQISARSTGAGWGPRRALVWLAERFARLPEHFSDAERIPRALALAENEQNVANNATGVWLQLFRIVLSGTANPFDQRLELLRSHLFDERDAALVRLSLRAFDGILSWHGSRMLGPPVIGGRIPPPEWIPRTRKERRAAYESTVKVLEDAALSKRPELASGALDAVTSHVRELLGWGFLKNLRAIAAKVTLTRKQLGALLDDIQTYLLYDAERPDGAPAAEYVADVRHWRDELVPADDLRARLNAFLLTPAWGSRRIRDEDGWATEKKGLAQELSADTKRIATHLDLLLADEAETAGELGDAIGEVDCSAAHLNTILTAAVSNPSITFVRGYVHGLVRSHAPHREDVNKWLDGHAESHPALVADLAIVGGDALHAYERVVELYDQGVIPWYFLITLAHRGSVLDDDHFAALIERMLVLIDRRVEGSLKAAVDIMEFRAIKLGKAAPLSTTLAPLGWRLLEAVNGEPWTQEVESYAWIELLKRLGATDVERASDLAARVMVGDDFRLSHEVEDVLAEFARKNPDAVVNSLGRIMLDEEKGWRFFVGGFRKVFQALPEETIQQWLEGAGVEAARHIARHLPEPYLSDGAPVVPPLTAFVLTKYEQDDRVFREFAAGVDSFKTYWGDIASQLETEAETASKFLDHPIRRIREWAEVKVSDARHQAAREREEKEEMDIP